MAKDKTELIREIMHRPVNIRNIAIAAHIDHGKTTLTDSLVAGAGMISEELAGTQLFTDFDKQEQERGITIFSANVSMVHEFEQPDASGVMQSDNYLINLIDTPGHVDFGGDVTRAMRAVDGAIILTDAVEGVMPQTETVLRQALHERVKPVLFINKVDRLIRELKLTPEQMQERFIAIIRQVNILIQKYAEKEYAEKWLVKVEDGSVAFGSGYRKWAISVPSMKQKNITFKQIIDLSSQQRDSELSKMAPLHQILLNMVIKHLPNPQEAQKYRISRIWHGDLESEPGKSMLSMDEKGPLALIVTKVMPDPHAGIVATGRIFSGTLKRGQEVRLIGQHMTRRVQQVSVYKGPQRVQMEEIVAGNIVGIVGLNDAFSGETVCDSDREIEPFEAIKHIFEPVVTKSIEAKDPKDLPKLIIFLKQVSREDPTLVVKINEDTGEYLVSGLGELHLDAKVERPLKDKGIDIVTSPPIVIYHETARSTSPEVEGKSSNKHNRFYVIVEPMEPELFQALSSGKIETTNVKKYLKELIPKLVENGLERHEAKKLQEIYENNILIDATKGIQYLNETMELIIEAFKNTMNSGPMAHEPCSGLKIKLVDAKLHEDAIHRGPAQVLPALSDAIREGIMRAKPTLIEPIQTIRIDTPEDTMGNAMNLVQNKRGQIIDVKTELGAAIVQAKMPVAEMIGFESQLKSTTGGKGFYSLIDVTFEKLPDELKDPVVKKIRQRKGLSEPASQA
jgi:elongation factor 2